MDANKRSRIAPRFPVLDQIKEELGLPNDLAFSKAVGLAPSTISRLRRGETGAGYKTITCTLRYVNEKRRELDEQATPLTFEDMFEEAA